MEAIGKCALTYTLQTHESLNKVKKYVPDNVVLSGDDIIPGVDENADEVVHGVIDILRNPNPLQSWPCILKKVWFYLSCLGVSLFEQSGWFGVVDFLHNIPYSPRSIITSIYVKNQKISGN